MEEEKDLDHILLDQYHAAKRQRKTVDRLIKVCPEDEGFLMCREANEKRILFFESVIEDKSILKKKVKRVKCDDIFGNKNVVFEIYRYSLFVTFYSYKVFWNSMKSYANQFNKKTK